MKKLSKNQKTFLSITAVIVVLLFVLFVTILDAEERRNLFHSGIGPDNMPFGYQEKLNRSFEKRNQGHLEAGEGYDAQ